MRCRLRRQCCVAPSPQRPDERAGVVHWPPHVNPNPPAGEHHLYVIHALGTAALIGCRAAIAPQPQPLRQANSTATLTDSGELSSGGGPNLVVRFGTPVRPDSHGSQYIKLPGAALPPCSCVSPAGSRLGLPWLPPRRWCHRRSHQAQSAHRLSKVCLTSIAPDSPGSPPCAANNGWWLNQMPPYAQQVSP